MAQRYTRILEDHDITLPFSTIATCMFYENKLVIYCGRTTGTFKLLFSSVVAYRSHDDFHHPDNWVENKAEYPKTKDGKYPYQALEVIDSDWLSSFPGFQSRFGGKPAKHYKFASYNNVVDILSLKHFSEIAIDSGELDKIDAIVK